MVKFLFIAYIVCYLAVAAGGIWSDLRSKYVWWLVLIDLFGSVLSLVGMILFLAEIRSPQLISAFAYGFPLIVLSYFFVTAIDIYDELKEDPENKLDTLIGFLLALLFEIPCLLILFQYTYRS
ncbi:MAG: hypothetical protein Q8T09_01810 [Candidatus Melainabacteria bacterium]|nr:hypothetical protein [Candidatus Melainabacteria bacterium]